MLNHTLHSIFQLQILLSCLLAIDLRMGEIDEKFIAVEEGKEDILISEEEDLI